MTTPLYQVVLNDFADTATFGIGSTVANFENLKNLGYAHYVNDVGEMFFTITQKDAKAINLRSLVDTGGHVRVFRGADNVWSGWIGDADETGRDIIVYGYSYEAGFFERMSTWAQEWISQQINTIFSDLLTTAKSGQSRVGWLTSGTIEVPVTTSGGATPYVLNKYTLYYKRVLFAYQELMAAAISDTTNRVLFEVTPAGVVNLWKNRGTDLTDLKFIYGDPKILSYRRQRTPADHRNSILAVGSTPRDVALRSTQTDAADVTAQGGLRQESVYLQWVRDQAALDSIAKIRLARAKRKDSSISFTFAPGALTPFRATGQSYKLTDGVHCIIQNGATLVDEIKIITGQQVLLYRGQEIVRPLLWDRL